MKEKKFYTTAEMGKMYGVDQTTVRYWIKKGMPFRWEKIIGQKPRIVVTLEDVEAYLGLGISDEEVRG